ncbi:MAG TPA: hypothetical protein VG722_07180, partial [Tepidisphaeraceae bacterium]|nr:hypothetical protein [Tepidisphaeraceae bacterium]
RQARYFCKRLHRRGDDTPIVVALWNNRIEPHVARRRIAPEPSVHVATSLGKLIATINQLAPLIKADMTD